eukprot:764982-Hanusia_phi.AAC.2
MDATCYGVIDMMVGAAWGWSPPEARGLYRAEDGINSHQRAEQGCDGGRKVARIKADRRRVRMQGDQKLTLLALEDMGARDSGGSLLLEALDAPVRLLQHKVREEKEGGRDETRRDERRREEKMVMRGGEERGGGGENVCGWYLPFFADFGVSL